ncbi:hypothetical protein D3C71_1511370 [compost metagenome]
MEQAVQQFAGRQGQQFLVTQGVEQGADADPAVFVAAVAGQFLQQQAGGVFAVAGQQ